MLIIYILQNNHLLATIYLNKFLLEILNKNLKKLFDFRGKSNNFFGANSFSELLNSFYLKI